MGMLNFYRECFARAFTGKFFLVEKWSGGLGLVAVAATRFAPIPEGWDVMIQDDLPLYFFLCIFLMTVFLGFVTAPYSIYKEEREKAFLLQKAREPKLKVFVKEIDGTREFVGSTNQTQGGMRLTTSLYAKTSSAVSLVVANIGETRVEKCTACLVWIERLDGDGDVAGVVELFEPIFLPWHFTETEDHLRCSIEPNTSKRVWIADVNFNGWMWVMRDIEKLPAGYQHIFGGSGRYRAIIQVSDGESLSVQTKVEITCAENDKKNSYAGGTASIFMLEQASPNLERSGIGA